MTPTRVLVAARPRPLCLAVHDAVTGEPDLAAVDVPGGEVELLLRAGQGDADLVVVAMAGRTLPAVAERLVDEYPQIAVLAVDLLRDEGMLYRLHPRTTLLHDLAADGLAAALRNAAGDRGGQPQRESHHE